MKMYRCMGIVGLAAAGLFAGQVFATACPTAPATGIQTQGGPTCIAPYGSDGANTGLQSELDNLTVSGPGIDVYNGQYTPSGNWEIGITGGSENTLLFEIAGNANVNSFGIYDPTDTSHTLQLFSGTMGAGTRAALESWGGGLFTNGVGPNGNGTGLPSSKTATFGDGSLYGYYLDTPNGTFYSDPILNQDPGNPYPGGMRHMVAYQGDGVTKLQIGNRDPSPFLSDEYLLAWEDQPFENSDLDYNDFVVAVESVRAVPEPAVLGMFGFGLLLIGGFVALRRRSAHRV